MPCATDLQKLLAIWYYCLTIETNFSMSEFYFLKDDLGLGRQSARSDTRPRLFTRSMVSNLIIEQQDGPDISEQLAKMFPY